MEIGSGIGESKPGEGGDSAAVLVAGATGVLGREVVRALTSGGTPVRALSRRPGRTRARGEATPAGNPEPPVRPVAGDVLRPASLRGACDGVEVVISAVGASLDPKGIIDRTSYDRVDHRGNRALLEEALRAGVRRFIYVSVFDGPALERLEYVAAHARFADVLQESGLEHTVVRPTGFFSLLADAVRMARAGRGLVIGDGAARTNPVHEVEVAAAVAGAARVDRPDPVINMGGPDVLTRREIVELAFRAVGRPPRITTVSPNVLRAASLVVGPLNPRLSALLRFGVEVSLVDVVAPSRGRRRLIDYFRALAAAP